MDMYFMYEHYMPLAKHRRLPIYYLYAAEDYTLRIGEVTKVNTGVWAASNALASIEVRPLDDLASKGVMIVNSPVTVNGNFHGEICMYMTVLDGTYHIKKRDKIAQLVVTPWMDTIVADHFYTPKDLKSILLKKGVHITEEHSNLDIWIEALHACFGIHI